MGAMICSLLSRLNSHIGIVVFHCWITMTSVTIESPYGPVPLSADSFNVEGTSH